MGRCAGQPSRCSSRKSSSNRSDTPRTNDGYSRESPSLWEYVLLRLRNYWNRSRTTLSRRRSSCSTGFTGSNASRSNRALRPVSFNADRAKFANIISTALACGTARDLVVRDGRHFAITVEARPCDTPTENNDPLLVARKEDAAAAFPPTPPLREAAPQPQDAAPQPLSVEKAKTLKIDKIFRNGSQNKRLRGNKLQVRRTHRVKQPRNEQPSTSRGPPSSVGELGDTSFSVPQRPIPPTITTGIRCKKCNRIIAEKRPQIDPNASGSE